MATTFQSSKVASGVQPLAGIGVHDVYAVYELTAALVINDVIQMVKIPTGATVTQVTLSCDDIDSGSTLTLSVGDDSVVDRFIKTSTIGQAGGTVTLGSGITGAAAADALTYQYTADDTIDIKAIAAATGAGTGATVRLAVQYTMQQ